MVSGDDEGGVEGREMGKNAWAWSEGGEGGRGALSNGEKER